MNRKFFLTEKESKYFEYMQSFQDRNGIFDTDATKFVSLQEFKNNIL